MFDWVLSTLLRSYTGIIWSSDKIQSFLGILLLLQIFVRRGFWSQICSILNHHFWAKGKGTWILQGVFVFWNSLD